MTPVPQSRLRDVIFPIMAAAIKETRLSGRTTPEYTLTVLEAHYGSKEMAAYVDDLDNPTSCLICGVHRNPVIDELFASAYLVWVRADLRKSRKSLKLIDEMIVKLKEYGIMMNCHSATGSDWCYLGSSTGLRSVWEKHEFELQERHFTIIL